MSRVHRKLKTTGPAPSPLTTRGRRTANIYAPSPRAERLPAFEQDLATALGAAGAGFEEGTSIVEEQVSPQSNQDACFLESMSD